MTSIYRVIDRAVANPLVVHHFHNLGDGTYILLCFTVQFYIRDMSAARNGVERSFTLDFLNDADRFFHIYVERVDIIVTVCHSGDFSIFPTIHFGETSRKSFGRSSQNGVVQVIFFFIFVYHFIHFHHSFIQRVPCFLVVSVTLSVESHHRIVSADKSDTQRAAAQCIPHLLVRVQLTAAFPHIISHHERELTCQGRTLILITLIKLIGYKNRHSMYGFDENFFCLLFNGILVAFILYQVFRLDTGFDRQSRHIQRSERKIATT